jgi:transposase
MVSAISNRGQLWFMVFGGRLNARLFVGFLGRLLRAVGDRKLFLIIDAHPVHTAAAVAAWLGQEPARSARLALFFLPGYSPDLNPDECLNQDTKQAMKKARPATLRQMMGNVRSHLHRRQMEPQIVKRFFTEEHVRYAAA